MNTKNLKAIFSKTSKVLNSGPTEPAGFTLVELLVAMAVSTIMLAAVVRLFSTLNTSYTQQNATAEVQQVARGGIDFMAQGIRMAGLDPRQTGNFGITEAESDRISFAADYDLSGGVAGPGETVSYFLNGDELMSSLDAVPLVENVDIANGPGLRFTYLADDNSIIPQPVSAPDLSTIRTVRISLTVREPAGRDRTVARTYATEVKCRNIGL